MSNHSLKNLTKALNDPKVLDYCRRMYHSFTTVKPPKSYNELYEAVRILGFIGYATYRGSAHMKRFPLHYLAGFALCLILGICFIRTAAKPTTVADTKLGKSVTLYDKTQNLDEFLTLELKNNDKTIKASTENIPSDFIKRVRSTDNLTKSHRHTHPHRQVL